MLKTAKASSKQYEMQNTGSIGNKTFQSQIASNTYGSKKNMNETLSIIKFQREFEGKRSPFKVSDN